MHRLLIELSPDRSRCGALTLFDPEGRRVCGPFPVAGRASDRLAAAHGNPGRDPRLRYGDTPAGGYRLARILKSGRGTGFSAAEFGAHGVAVLEAISGVAAAAEANGRFHLLIIGGKAGKGGTLRSTAGALRLANDHLSDLMAAMRGVEAMGCDILASATAADQGPVVDDAGCRQEDPMPLPREEARAGRIAGRPASRREALRVGAAGAAGLTAFRLSVSFLAAETVASMPALAYGASPSSASVASPAGVAAAGSAQSQSLTRSEAPTGIGKTGAAPLTSIPDPESGGV